MIGRRALVQALGAAPVMVVMGGCSSRPRTPLDHLYGERWVQGAYELYAQGYAKVEDGAEREAFGSYQVLAQRGIVALDGLQTRGVPFFVRAQPGAQKFLLERKVPERLTFTADMSAEGRAAATASWEQARDHIHTDYEEIRRLDGALTTLLTELRRVRLAIDEGRIEGYRITRQLAPLAEGQAPFELPYQVAIKDYENVLYLLLAGLDEDARRLAEVEASIAAVGLIARSTDANSGSLAANLRKVLVSVVTDADAQKPRDATYPSADDRRAAQLQRGRDLAVQIRASEAYVAWEKRERAKQLEAIGSLLATLDAVTGLPTSAIFQQVMEVWQGDGDYLSYLRTLARVIPGGSAVARVLESGIDRTEKTRDVLAGVSDTSAEGLAAAAKKKGAGLLNTGSAYAVTRARKQLVFFSDAREASAVEEALNATKLGG